MKVTPFPALSNLPSWRQTNEIDGIDCIVGRGGGGAGERVICSFIICQGLSQMTVVLKFLSRLNIWYNHRGWLSIKTSFLLSFFLFFFLSLSLSLFSFSFSLSLSLSLFFFFASWIAVSIELLSELQVLTNELRVGDTFICPCWASAKRFSASLFLWEIYSPKWIGFLLYIFN